MARGGLLCAAGSGGRRLWAGLCAFCVPMASERADRHFLEADNSVAADQESPGGGEAKFHGLFMLLLKLTRKTLSGVTQPSALHSAWTLCGSPCFPAWILRTRKFPGSRVVNKCTSGQAKSGTLITVANAALRDLPQWIYPSHRENPLGDFEKTLTFIWESHPHHVAS